MLKNNKSFGSCSADTIWSTPQNYIAHLEDNTFFRESFEVLEARVMALKPQLILDIGSGFGWTSLLLASWVKPHFLVSCDPAVDITDNGLTFLARKMKLDVDSLTVKRKTWKFDDISSVDTSWDMIVAVASIHHADDIFNALSSLYVGLKPGGTLILANEVIHPRHKFRLKLIKKILKILYHSFTNRWALNDQLVGQGRFKYDSELGDWSISKDYYCYLAEVIGFKDPEFIETDFVSYKMVGHPGNETRITHVILTKPS